MSFAVPPPDEGTVTYFHPPGCLESNGTACDETRVKEICGEDLIDPLSYEDIRAPFLKGLFHGEYVNEKDGTTWRRKRGTDGQLMRGFGKCYNDSQTDHGLRHYEMSQREMGSDFKEPLHSDTRVNSLPPSADIIFWDYSIRPLSIIEFHLIPKFIQQMIHNAVAEEKLKLQFSEDRKKARALFRCFLGVIAKWFPKNPFRDRLVVSIRNEYQKKKNNSFKTAEDAWNAVSFISDEIKTINQNLFLINVLNLNDEKKRNEYKNFITSELVKN